MIILFIFLFIVIIVFLILFTGIKRKKINSPDETVSREWIKNISVKKILGVILLLSLLLIIFIFAEEIVDFDWTRISIGRVVEKNFGKEATVWIWIVPFIVLSAFFSFLFEKNLFKENLEHLLILAAFVFLFFLYKAVTTEGGDKSEKRHDVEVHSSIYGEARGSNYVAPKPTHPIIGTCVGRFAKLKGCERVTFRGDSFTRTAGKGLCLVYNPKSIIRREDLGNSTYRFTAPNGVNVFFFDLAIGEKFENFTCGR